MRQNVQKVAIMVRIQSETSMLGGTRRDLKETRCGRGNSGLRRIKKNSKARCFLVKSSGIKETR